MLKWFKKKIEYLYDKKIDASGLALFRIFYSLVLFGEVAQLYFFRHLMFDKIPYVELSEIDFSLPLIIWLGVLVMLMLGLYVRTASILNYLFSLVFISTIHAYEYHMFFIYMGVNFVMMFIDTGKSLSLDRTILRLKHSSSKFNYLPAQVTPVLNYYVLILVGIGFMYFDSVFYKYMAKLWTAGLGVWLPSSMPQVAYVDHSYLLNQKWVVIFLGYLTLLFESVFIFLFWFKRFRIPLFIVGVGLHLGIMFVYPIPWFALGYVALYLLLIPVSCWKKLRQFITFKSPRVVIFFDQECPLCRRTRIIIDSLDFLNAIEWREIQIYAVNETALQAIPPSELYSNIYSIDAKGNVRSGVKTYIRIFRFVPLFYPLSMLLRLPGIYHLSDFLYSKISSNRVTERCTDANCGYTPPPVIENADDIRILKNVSLRDVRISMIKWSLITLVILQMNSIYNSHLIQSLANASGISKTYPGKVFRNLSKRLQKNTKIVLGITGHTVFLDNHFNGYNHIIAIKHEESGILLPIIDQDGSPGYYLSGPTWAKWSFRVNGPVIKKEKLESGIRDFTAFWLTKHGMRLNNQKFIVMVKKIEPVSQWEENYLTIQKGKPWMNAGTVEWKDKKFTAEISDIESL